MSKYGVSQRTFLRKQSRVQRHKHLLIKRGILDTYGGYIDRNHPQAIKHAKYAMDWCKAGHARYGKDW